MVAVGVFVSNSPDLAQLHVRGRTLVIRILLERWRIRVVPRLSWARAVLLSKVLTGQQQHLLVEAADDGDLRLRLRRSLTIGSLSSIRLLLRIRLLSRRDIGRYRGGRNLL